MRLIPAHAGKTLCAVCCGVCMAAHPRSRGENYIVSRAGIEPAGSSPLTRGKPDTYDSPPLRARLIPAHAGKTCPHRSRMPNRRAHPRSRGENPGAEHWAGAAPGSSPLTRGKPWVAKQAEEQGRLIPAHAGKTLKPAAEKLEATAHPRSRGENTWLLPRGQRARGSSPLTRGKHRRRCPHTAAGRLIPAHAGKTLSPPC